MATAKMTSKGQITIPKSVRDALGLKVGTTLTVVVDDGKAVLSPRSVRAIDLAGILGKPPRGAGMAVSDMDKAVGDAVVERFEKSTKR
jgi:antitoxin PrlF